MNRHARFSKAEIAPRGLPNPRSGSGDSDRAKLHLPRFLFLTFCLASAVACLPVAAPPPAETATAIVAPSPPPGETATAIVAPSPPPATSLPLDQALRPEFATDIALFPAATRYEIDLTVDLDTLSVAGHENISYTNTKDVPLDALYLRFFPQTPGYGGDVTATNIMLAEQALEPVSELGGSALRLPLDPPLATGAELDVALDFTVSIPTSGVGYRQFGYYDGVLALANVYPIIPVYDDEGWNVEMAPTYGDAVYSDSSFYSVHITAPAGMTLAASGDCLLLTSAVSGNDAWECVAAPMRDFNAILGQDYRTESSAAAGTTVNSLFYSNHRTGGEMALDYAAEAVRIFSALFGPYPFDELDVVETPTSAGGIEYPGLVVINAAYYAPPPSEDMEWVVVHETAHQWWYSLVGNDQVDEPWLDEALTQYSTLLYFEKRYGQETANALLDAVFRQPYEKLVKAGRDAPAGLPVASYSDEDYGPLVYQKGPLYFHELRQAVGDDDFWAILQTYFERNRYSIAAPEDWLGAVEAVTGDEHRALYEQWIAGTERGQ